VQCCNNRHPQITQESQDVASGLSTEYPILELQAYQIDIVDVEEVGCAPVGVNVLLREFKRTRAG